jgi:hypothetical protein
MTFEELLALDDNMLNILIEQVLYPEHHWHQCHETHRQRTAWYLDAEAYPGGRWSTVPHLHHTAQWERTMALAWRYKISLWAGTSDGPWVIDCEGGILSAFTEEEGRRAICRAAVWKALHEQKTIVSNASQEAQDAPGAHETSRT